MSEPTNTEIMEKLGRIDERFTIAVRDAETHRNKILDTVEHNNQRISFLEKWVEHYKIRKEEREKYYARAREANAANLNPVPVGVLNDPKVAKAVIAFLAAGTGVLLVLQATIGAS